MTDPEMLPSQSTTNARRDGGFSPVRQHSNIERNARNESPDDVTFPQPTRKLRPRIQGFDYTGEHAYHVIMRTAHSRCVFSDASLANATIATLVQVADTTGFVILAYSLLPNHLHMLVQGQSARSDLGRFTQRFKQLTGFNYKKRTSTQLWQTSYYDRALRRDDDLQIVADYIFMNPVKDGLAQDARLYPFSGGVFFDVTPPDGAEAAVPTSAAPLRSREET